MTKRTVARMTIWAIATDEGAPLGTMVDLLAYSAGKILLLADKLDPNPPLPVTMNVDLGDDRGHAQIKIEEPTVTGAGLDALAEEAGAGEP